jgi:hypothetical protein
MFSEMQRLEKLLEVAQQKHNAAVLKLDAIDRKVLDKYAHDQEQYALLKAARGATVTNMKQAKVRIAQAEKRNADAIKELNDAKHALKIVGETIEDLIELEASGHSSD